MAILRYAHEGLLHKRYLFWGWTVPLKLARGSKTRSLNVHSRSFLDDNLHLSKTSSPINFKLVSNCCVWASSGDTLISHTTVNSLFSD